MMKTIAQRKAEVCETLRGALKLWDAQQQDPNIEMKQLHFLQQRIDGLCRELDILNREENVGTI